MKTNVKMMLMVAALAVMGLSACAKKDDNQGQAPVAPICDPAQGQICQPPVNPIAPINPNSVIYGNLQVYSIDHLKVMMRDYGQCGTGGWYVWAAECNNYAKKGGLLVIRFITPNSATVQVQVGPYMGNYYNMVYQMNVYPINGNQGFELRGQAVQGQQPGYAMPGYPGQFGQNQFNSITSVRVENGLVTDPLISADIYYNNQPIAHSEIQNYNSFNNGVLNQQLSGNANMYNNQPRSF